ncbi:mucin-5AC isoform X1 [Drosophila willistoni]|uniref:mucin-5AC isoform X1 n=1 Tax=Drosophila willistoni TaxID=7260 RepID=UPI001F082F44|nr:mucin-5AC isoform X1 [Drosophila willistoni]
MDDSENTIPDLGPMTDLKTAIERGTVTLLTADERQYNLSSPEGEVVLMATDDSSLAPSDTPPPLIPLSETSSKKIFYLKSFDEQFSDLQPQRIKSICSEAKHQGAIPKSSSVGSSPGKGVTKFSVPNVMETEQPVALSTALDSPISEPELGPIPKKRIPFKPIIWQHFATIEPEPEDLNVIETEHSVAMSTTLPSPISEPELGSIPKKRIPIKPSIWRSLDTKETEPVETLSTMPSTSTAKQGHLTEKRNSYNMENWMLKSPTVASRFVEATIPKLTSRVATPLAASVGKEYPRLIHFATTGAEPPTTTFFKARPKASSTGADPSATTSSKARPKASSTGADPQSTTSLKARPKASSTGADPQSTTRLKARPKASSTGADPQSTTSLKARPKSSSTGADPQSTTSLKARPKASSTGADPPATTSLTARPMSEKSIQSKFKITTASKKSPITSSSEGEKEILQVPSERATQRKSRKQKFPVRPEGALESPIKLMTLDPIPSTALSARAGAKRQLPYDATFEKQSKTTKALVSKANTDDLKPNDDSITPSMALQSYPLSTASDSKCQLSTGSSSEKRTKIKQKKKKRSSAPTATVTGPPVSSPSKPKTNLGKGQAESTSSSKKRSQPKSKNRKVPKATASKAQLPIVSSSSTTSFALSTTTTYTSYRLLRCTCIGGMPGEPMDIQPFLQALTLPIAPIVELPMAPIVELPIDPVVELPMAPIVEHPMDPIVELPMAPIVELPIDPIVELPMHPIVELPMALPPTTCVANTESTIAPISEEYTLYQPFEWHMTTASTLVSSTGPWDMAMPLETEPPLQLMSPLPDTSPELEWELLQASSTSDPSPPIEEPLTHNNENPTQANESMQSFLLMDAMFSSTTSSQYIFQEISNSAITLENFGQDVLDQISDIL